MPQNVDPCTSRFGKPIGKHIDSHMGILLEGVSGTQQKHGAEQIPLNFKQAIAAGVKHFADHCVVGRHQGGEQY